MKSKYYYARRQNVLDPKKYDIHRFTTKCVRDGWVEKFSESAEAILSTHSSVRFHVNHMGIYWQQNPHLDHK